VAAVIVDCETTPAAPCGPIDPRTDRIVELAAVGVDERGAIVDARVSLVRPDVPMSATASAIHHLVDADVMHFPDAATVIERLGLLEAPALVAHNGQYDFAILTRERPELASKPKLCTLRAARRLFPDAPSHKNQVLRYHLGLGLPPDLGPSHRALSDAVVTAALLARMLRETTLEELLAGQSRPVLLGLVTVGPAKMRGRPWSEVDVGLLRWFLAPGRDFDEDVRHTAQHWLQRRTAA
jgi:exodeoxyribonuclease X